MGSRQLQLVACVHYLIDRWNGGWCILGYFGNLWASLVIVISCLYIPMALVALTVEHFTPPAGRSRHFL
jgi:hypothetical protein